MQKITDKPITRCEVCGGQVRRLISNTAFVLKGSGWYVTDYPSEGRKKGMKQEDQPASTSKEEKSDGGGKSSGAPKSSSTKKDDSTS
jgi:predicted nucleic acid-binding Zn ribbon protein